MPNPIRQRGNASYKAIPDPVAGDDSLYHAVVAMKEVIEVLTRQRKPLLSSAVTFQDLVDYGLIATDGRALQDYGTLMNELANPGVGTTYLEAGNNLSDLDDAPTARTNLGLATVAATGAYADLTGEPNPAMELLTSGNVANSASSLDIVLTSYTSYRALQFNLINFRPATDSTQLLMRTSTNGGSSYDSGASNYDWGWGYVNHGSGAVAGSGSSADTKMHINGSTGNATTDSISATVILPGQTDTAAYQKLHWTATILDSGSIVYSLFGGGMRLSAADIDAVQFLWLSGNFASSNAGNYSVYGLK